VELVKQNIVAVSAATKQISQINQEVSERASEGVSERGCSSGVIDYLNE
jgi:hypothetical protein